MYFCQESIFLSSWNFFEPTFPSKKEIILPVSLKTRFLTVFGCCRNAKYDCIVVLTMKVTDL